MRRLPLISSGITSLLLAACGTPLTEQQKLQGQYVCKATGDQMIFQPDGRYRYTLNGADYLWDGSYTYDSPPSAQLLADAPNAWEHYNKEGEGSRFTYATSGQCYVGGRPRWDNPRFVGPEKKDLLLTSDGKKLRYTRVKKAETKGDRAGLRD